MSEHPIAPLMRACRCCGVPVEGMRAQFRVCTICDVCDNVHGDALQAKALQVVASGACPMWHAIAACALDDAHLAGKLQCKIDPSLPPDPDGTVRANLWIPVAPRRWEIVIGRAAARNVMPDMTALLGACLSPFIPCANTPANIEAMRLEIEHALRFCDPNCTGVEVACELDTLDAAHIVIKANMSVAARDAVTNLAPDVAIPVDILSRQRGQA